MELPYNPRHICRIERHRPAPSSKSAVRIDCRHPLVQKSALGFVFLCILSFGFQNEMICVDQTNNKIRPVFFDHALPDGVNFKTEMVVLHPGIDIGIAVELNRSGRSR